MPDLQPIFNWLQMNPGWIGWVIFLIALAESLAVVGIVVPGVVLLFGIAAIAGSGVLDVWTTLTAAFFGAVLGDGLSFFLGRYFHQHIKDFWPFRSHPHWIENGERFFQRHGGKSIILGRFIGPIRPFIPMVAGMLDMPTTRFIFTNVLSAIGWAPVYLLPGYYIGSSIQSGDEITRTIMLWILLGTLIGWGILWVFRRTSQQLAYGGRLYQWTEVWAGRENWRQSFWRRYQQPLDTPNVAHPHSAMGAILTSDQNHWFPLGALSLLLFCVLLFISLATAVVFELPGLIHVDQSLRAVTQDLRTAIALKTDLVERFFEYITLLGDHRTLWGILALFSIVLLKRRNWAILVHGWAIALLAPVLSSVLKSIFKIPRPDGAPDWISSAAFPSGHTVSAVVLFGFSAYLLNEKLIRPHHWKVYLVSAMPILLVALSRLYLDFHWFSDLIGAGLVGLFCCAIAAFSFHRFSGANQSHRNP